MNVPCKICNQRRARRECPGVNAGICAQCCGTERENSVDCPRDCQHLMARGTHEQLLPIPEDQIPNRDVRVTEEFIQTHEHLITWLTLRAGECDGKGTRGRFDAREALDALARTYRTLESGLIYETKPQNPFAASIQEALGVSVEELGKELAKETGMYSLRDAEVFGALVFLQRLEMQHNNGRRRGRAFFDFMRSYFPERSRGRGGAALSNSNEPALIVFAHGSSIESANEAVRVVTKRAAQRGSWRAFETAFLEGGKPDLGTAIDNLASRGETKCRECRIS